MYASHSGPGSPNWYRKSVGTIAVFLAVFSVKQTTAQSFTEHILAELKHRGLKAVIPPSVTRKVQRRYDKDLYPQRYLVECFFHNIKRFRRIATRYEKTIECFTGFLCLACAFQWII